MTPMIRRSLPLLLCTAVLALTAACSVNSPVAESAEVPRQFPVRDFFSNPERAYFRLSDDGKTLGFMQPVAEGGGQRRLNVFVQALDGSRLVGAPRKLTSESARDIGIYFWKGNDTILYVKDFGGDENFHVVAVDVTTGGITDLTPGGKVRAAIENVLSDDPGHILVTHNRRNVKFFDVYRVDIRSGAETMVAQNPGDVTAWQTDHGGRVRIATRFKGLETELLYRPDEKSAFEPIITTNYRTQVSPAFFSADNSKIYMLSNRGRDKKALVLIDPKRPDAEELLFADPDFDLGGESWFQRAEAAVWSHARKRLSMVSYPKARMEHKFFDPYIESVFTRLRVKLPGMEFRLQNFNKAEDKFIVAAYNDRTPGARHIYDVKADTLFKLGDINPKLPEGAMSTMKPIQYKSRDGLTIHGYLTLPAGRQPKNLACIVKPHGGPWLRDSWGYNPEIQFLANRGFCVLQMNFRGSTGYGRTFWEAGFGQWGLKMQDDITDGAQWLVAQGIADPRRIGIYGVSYGGYAALAGVAFTPDLYAAAVDYVGISNLFTFMNTTPPYWKWRLPLFHEMIGNPEVDIARMTATSPALHADRIRTPLFVAQGARDPRVNKAESDQMVEALKKRGVHVQYMVKDNEGHGFSNEENQFEFYEAMDKFFTQHLKP